MVLYWFINIYKMRVLGMRCSVICKFKRVAFLPRMVQSYMTMSIYSFILYLWLYIIIQNGRSYLIVDISCCNKYECLRASHARTTRIRKFVSSLIISTEQLK